jgi:hypothetical protein
MFSCALVTASWYTSAAGEVAPEGNSSIGRASVSKTEGWGFKSLLPCRVEAKQITVGKVAAWQTRKR